MEIAHSGRFFAAAVAEPSLPAFGASGYAVGCFVGWVSVGHWAAHRRGAIAGTAG